MRRSRPPSPPASAPDPLLTTAEVARLLRVHPKHIYRLLRRGLPARRVGGEWRFDREEVGAWSKAGGRPAPEAAVTGPPPLLAANDDEAVGLLLGAVAEGSGPTVGWVGADSGGALGLLGARRVLAAGFHRRDVSPRLEGKRLARVHLVRREVGLVTRPGRRRTRIEDATDLTLASRPPTAGARSVLDSELRRAGMDPEAVHARAHVFRTHRDVVCAVARGEADLGITSRDWAERVGLPFVPLALESYGLLILTEDLGDPAVVHLCETAQSADMRRLLASLPGHEAADAGAIHFDPVS